MENKCQIFHPYIYVWIHIYIRFSRTRMEGTVFRYTTRGGVAIRGLAKICLRHSWASASNTSALNQSIVQRRPDSVQVDSPLHDKSPSSFPTRGNRRYRRGERVATRKGSDISGLGWRTRPWESRDESSTISQPSRSQPTSFASASFTFFTFLGSRI